MTDNKAAFDEVQIALINFISQDFFVEKDEIDVESSLVDTGVIDSIGLIEIVSFIEKKYGISVSEEEMTKENFGSVVKIVKFILSNMN